MKANESGKIGKARAFEPLQQLDDAASFAATKAIAAGFDLGELVIERVGSHWQILVQRTVCLDCEVLAPR
jgi:hypothetical protein